MFETISAHLADNGRCSEKASFAVDQALRLGEEYRSDAHTLFELANLIMSRRSQAATRIAS